MKRSPLRLLVPGLALTLTLSLTAAPAHAAGRGARTAERPLAVFGNWLESLWATGLRLLASSGVAASATSAAEDPSDFGHGIDPNGLASPGPSAAEDPSEWGHEIDPDG